jgi:hypothetical protein
LFDARSAEEAEAYLSYLEQQGLIDRDATFDGTGCILTIPGWQRVEPVRQVGGTPGTCFIAMWFDPEMNEAYEFGIVPAVGDCGFSALRVDRKEHNNQITDEIMAGIRNAEFMVDDFTKRRHGVYYEAGFARGLGREVIYCCRTDSFDDRHFDTSVINHIVWTDPADLRAKLANRIRATILPKA